MSFGACSKREPVTTTSSTGAGFCAGAVWASANGVAEVAAVMSARRTALRTHRFEFVIRLTPLIQVSLSQPCSRGVGIFKCGSLLRPPPRLLLKCYTGALARAKESE